MIKYCVAEVNAVCGDHKVTFYAFKQGQYGLHRVADWDDENIIWFDTKEEAMNCRLNINDCVLCRHFEEV